MRIQVLAVFLACSLYLAWAGHNQCPHVTSDRAGLKAAALWAAKSGKYISYTQGSSRWSGIQKHVCPHQGVPAFTDCSAFVTWLYWSAFGKGTDFLNGEKWTAGYTGTQASHGVAVSRAHAQPGDVVLYGHPTISHAAMYVGNHQVVEFGQNGPARLRSIDYRSDLNQIRSYPSFFH